MTIRYTDNFLLFSSSIVPKYTPNWNISFHPSVCSFSYSYALYITAYIHIIYFNLYFIKNTYVQRSIINYSFNIKIKLFFSLTSRRTLLNTKRQAYFFVKYKVNFFLFFRKQKPSKMTKQKDFFLNNVIKDAEQRRERERGQK